LKQQIIEYDSAVMKQRSNGSFLEL